MRAVLLMVSGVAFLASATRAEFPPATTLERLEAASRFAETSTGAFQLTTRATISKTDGSDKEENVSVMRISRGAGGDEVVELVSARENGKDVTEKQREALAKQRAKHKGKGDKAQGAEDGEEDGVSLRVPGPSSAAKFDFSPLEGAPEACGARFAPRREHAKEEGLTVGELRWDCATLDPLWIDVRPSKNPSHVSEMRLRMEIARTGEALYVVRTVTDGIGGMLFIKRKFHIETEVVPETP